MAEVHIARLELLFDPQSDKLLKSMRKIIETYGNRRKCRDLVEFLEETEKSLEILLRNHLEDAMRKYLK